jgi:predicted nucleic acid-binding protein
MASYLGKLLPEGRSVFVDANVFHFYLRGPENARKVCTSFFEDVERQEIRGFTSSLVLDEVMFKILLKAIEDKHRKNPLEIIQKSSDQIGAQSKQVRRALDIILGMEGLEVLPVEKQHIETSVDYMETYSILPRDAVHLSVMKSIQCSDVASADSDFDRVLDVNRWTPLPGE